MISPCQTYLYFMLALAVFNNFFIFLALDSYAPRASIKVYMYALFGSIIGFCVVYWLPIELAGCSDVSYFRTIAITGTVIWHSLWWLQERISWQLYLRIAMVPILAGMCASAFYALLHWYAALGQI